MVAWHEYDPDGWVHDKLRLDGVIGTKDKLRISELQIYKRLDQWDSILVNSKVLLLLLLAATNGKARSGMVSKFTGIKCY